MSYPKHVAIILDGNRRFAKRLMLQPWKGHEYGVEKVKKIFDWGKKYDIKMLTLYTFSIQNFNRPKEEFDYLMNLFLKEFHKFKDDPKIKEYKIKIKVIGEKKLFPKEVQDALSEIEERTKNNDGYVINFAMAYGGRNEIVEASKNIVKDVLDQKLSLEDINEEIFENYLYIKDQPDMIIRTGGEKRISNFLSFQSAYSELFFLDKMWPEFEEEDLFKIMEEYKERERRFGK
jgi:tritrans,polycis-undecaprenyl-diphosphate synthase [geranylgeranyl-diphosphate specific]